MPTKAHAVDQNDEYIRIENVTKRFGDFVAVDNVSLSVFKSEIFCLLGVRLWQDHTAAHVGWLRVPNFWPDLHRWSRHGGDPAL